MPNWEMAMKTKVCCTCKIEKDQALFSKRTKSKDGLRERCKECDKIQCLKLRDHKKKYSKLYRAKNRDRIKQSKHDYYINNKQKCRNRMREYEKNRYHNDIFFRLKLNLRSRINLAIKNGYKSATTEELLGCSIEFLISFLESKFKEGMSWENRELWHIDHILPCSSFDLSDPEQQKLCFHYTNLQPLWAEENLSKRDKI